MSFCPSPSSPASRRAEGRPTRPARAAPICRPTGRRRTPARQTPARTQAPAPQGLTIARRRRADRRRPHAHHRARRERRHCKAGRRKRRSLGHEIVSAKSGDPVRRSELVSATEGSKEDRLGMTLRRAHVRRTQRRAKLPPERWIIGRDKKRCVPGVRRLDRTAPHDLDASYNDARGAAPARRDDIAA